MLCTVHFRTEVVFITTKCHCDYGACLFVCGNFVLFTQTWLLCEIAWLVDEIKNEYAYINPVMYEC